MSLKTISYIVVLDSSIYQYFVIFRLTCYCKYGTGIFFREGLTGQLIFVRTPTQGEYFIYRNVVSVLAMLKINSAGFLTSPEVSKVITLAHAANSMRVARKIVADILRCCGAVV